MTEVRSELLHATAVSVEGRGVLIVGPSGSGKSDLALRLIDRGAALVSDDQTLVRAIDGMLYARAPDTIYGRMEVRGLGILSSEAVAEARVALVIELTEAVERLPAPRSRMVAGVELPELRLDPRPPSAPIKVELALAHPGMVAE